MADDFTTLNAGAGGSTMDETGVTFPSDPINRKRPRVVIAGDNPADLAEVTALLPADNANGLVVRPLPSKRPHPGTTTCCYAGVTLVPANADTTVCQYVVPTGYTFFITGWYFSGDVNARYKLTIDTTTIAVLRTTSAHISDEAQFNVVQPEATESQTVKIVVNHAAGGIQANFDATILGYILPN